MRPKKLVEAWVAAFNRADSDTLASFYAADAINHQVAESAVTGREAIREMFERGFSTVEMKCIVENIFEDGEWAILEWRDPKGWQRVWFFSRMRDAQIVFQRGYWDKLTFLKLWGLAVPEVKF